MPEEKLLFYVSNLEWERVYLSIDVETDYEGETEFKLEKIGKIYRDENKAVTGEANVKKVVPLKNEKTGEHTYRIRCNVAAFDKRSFLDNGRWRIMAVTKKGEFVCYTKHDVAYDFDSYSRMAEESTLTTYLSAL